MKKVIIISLLGLLLSSGFQVYAQPYSYNNVEEIFESIHFSDIIFKNSTKNDFINVISESTTTLANSGEPMLPFVNRNYEFPIGTDILDINVKFFGKETKELPKKISPAPKPVLNLINNKADTQFIQEEKSVYLNTDLYPNKKFSYSYHIGLKDNNRVLILNIKCYPVQYSPTEDIVYISKSIDIKIEYKQPETFSVYPEIYDMVVITPSKFKQSLQPLIYHKNKFGLTTFLKTSEEIYNEYDGRDKPEKIKYCIKDYIEKFGIKYVLLVGGLKSQIWSKPRDDLNQGSIHWYLPVRYSNLKENSPINDPGYISDLYYSDIYKYVNGSIEFEDWDSNRNGIFAEWNGATVDVIDHYPDVYVGRLACRNNIEVKTLVRKIIKYEQKPADCQWFNRMIVIGGDSHYDPSTNYLEGELVCDKALSYMSDFESIKLYSSYKDTKEGLTPSSTNISREITKGGGFLLFDGHGNPGSWDTHWYGEYSWENTPGGISIYRFPFISNRDKLPITLIGGCHNSQINVSLLPTLTKKPYMWTYGMPVPECFSWWLVRKIGGGSIATLGSTGLGYGYVGDNSDLDSDGVNEPDAIEGLGGYLSTNFFKEYKEGANILGETWGATISNYLDTFQPMDDKIQMKCIQEWILLGDPSLMIGGYQ